MDKVEFYNACIDLRKKTGQGMPTVLKNHMGSEMIDGLVEEGLMKIVDDDTICLTKGYCVEADEASDEYGDEPFATKPLTFVRMYLGLKDLIDLGNLGKLTLKQAKEDTNIMAKYNIWLAKNQTALDEMMNIEEMPTVEKKKLNKKH